MAEATFVTLTAVFSLVFGSSAGLLSLLTYKVFRQSPFGRALFLLLAVFVIFVLYHGVVILYPGQSMLADLFKSGITTGVTLFVWIMVWKQYRLQSARTAEG